MATDGSRPEAAAALACSTQAKSRAQRVIAPKNEFTASGDGIARLRDRIASVAKEGGKRYLTPRRFVAEGDFVLVLSEGDPDPLRFTICSGSRMEKLSSIGMS